MKAGDRVEVRDFGSFTHVERAARAGRNPKTGAAVAIEAKADVNFKPGRAMNARLNHWTVEAGAKRRALLQTP